MKLSEIPVKLQRIEIGELYLQVQKTSDIADMDIMEVFEKPVIAEYFSAGVQKSGYRIINDKL